MYRRWYAKMNWPLLSVTLLLIVFGLIVIYSATFRDNPSSPFADVGRQTLAFFVGLTLAFLIFWTDYKRLCTFRIPIGGSSFSIRLGYVLYGVAVFLLLLVWKKGHSALGAQRWIRVGPLGTFEPSEFAKLAVLLALATFFSENREPLSPKSLFISGMITGVPLLLVLTQPDLGTSIVLAAIWLGLLFFLGMNPLLILTSVVVAGSAVFRVMKDYQRERLLIFLDPNKDPRGWGWNIIQSLIAVGSGRFAGKGLFAGTQIQLRFVPEHSTDFIFTVAAEELGFVGGFLLLILFFSLLWFGSKIALETEDRLGKLLAAGIVVMIFFHVFINIGMTMRIMPITGIPLPFISSGGSSLITNMVAIALLLNIEYRRDRILLG